MLIIRDLNLISIQSCTYLKLSPLKRSNEPISSLHTLPTYTTCLHTKGLVPTSQPRNKSPSVCQILLSPAYICTTQEDKHIPQKTLSWCQSHSAQTVAIYH